MATVIKQTIPKAQGSIKGSTIYDLLVQYHSFVREETEGDESDSHVTIKKLYYTENSYLELWWKDNVSTNNNTEFQMSAVTPNFEYANICSAVHGYDFYFKFIVSATGDISLLQDSAELVDGEDYKFSLVKCKNGLADDEMWGVYLPISEKNYSVKCLALDDTTSATDSISVIASGSTASSQYHYSGWNVNAQMVLLMPLCATTSKYLSQNTFIMYFTPQRFYGDTIIDEKHYYCVGLIAMLDE